MPFIWFMQLILQFSLSVSLAVHESFKTLLLKYRVLLDGPEKQTSGSGGTQVTL